MELRAVKKEINLEIRKLRTEYVNEKTLGFIVQKPHRPEAP